MPRGVKKQHLPQKICITCKRPFNWRKKWEKCWDEVTTCSKACNAARRAGKSKAGAAASFAEGMALFAELAPSGSDEESSEHGDGAARSDAEGESSAVEAQVPEADAVASITAAASSLPAEAAEPDAESSSPAEAPEAADAAAEAPPALPALSAAPGEDDQQAASSPAEAPEPDEESWTARRARVAEAARSDEARSKRKADRKAAKLAQRQKREGTDLSVGQKPCDMCSRPVDLLIRCRVDSTSGWRMVCGRCWKKVSGGVVDGDDDHPDYRYGGLWKNLHVRAEALAAQSA